MDYNQLKVTELKTLLSERGLESKGRKVNSFPKFAKLLSYTEGPD